MSPITRQDVLRLCDLAALDVEAAQVPRLVEELGRIVAYVSRLESVQAETGLADAAPEGAPPRADVVRPMDPPVPLEALVPRMADGFVLVPRVGRGEDEAG